MPLPGKERKVVEGERHIYSVASDTQRRITEKHQKAVCTSPVLTSMRNIDCCQQQKATIKKDSFDKKGKSEKMLGTYGSHIPPNISINYFGNIYRVPKICSSHHVAGMLNHARETQPNIPQLLKAKLNSPKAAVELKNQVCIFGFQPPLLTNPVNMPITLSLMT